ncbi:MAG: MFS transporter, partial [Acidobacteria bacterium]|nr:MFS transporter [Acidobacteriota bacterium]
GGLVSAAFGRDTTFILNSISFFVSAVMIARLRIPPRTEPMGEGGFTPFVEGAKYLSAHRNIAALALIKAGWATVGGALLILTVLGQRVFVIGGSGDAGTGILYAARGVGALAGSWLVTHLAMKSSERLIRLIAPSYFIAGAFYALIGVAPTIWIAAALVVGAHICGSILWVASNVMLQLNVRDQFRGRVFTAELAALTIIQSASSYITALLLDRWHIDPRMLAIGCGLILWVPGTVWAIRAARKHSD